MINIKSGNKIVVSTFFKFKNRPNVFPIDDFGIQSNMKRWYNINLDKKELRTRLVEIAETWDPYKSLACKFLWKSGDM